MKELLGKLTTSLAETFQSELASKELKSFDNKEIDVFQTFLCLAKTHREFRRLLEASALDKEILDLEFNKELVDKALKNGLLRRGYTINNQKLFIATAGLARYYQLMDYNLSLVFMNYDETRFSQEQPKLKSQEKIWCTFLILFGAHSQDEIFDTTKLNDKKLKQYFEFFKLIEAEMYKHELNLGKKIGWGSGKDIDFRKFITNNVDLPITGIYVNKPNSMYWLDLGKRKYVKFLLDLILDSYSPAERILANNLFLEALRNLSNQILTVLHEVPKELNAFIIDELKN